MNEFIELSEAFNRSAIGLPDKYVAKLKVSP